MTKGLPDPEVIRRHLAALAEALGHLGPYSGRTASELRNDAALRWTIERGLQLCAQNALDIATHIAAASGLDSPDYATAIDRLGELGVLPADFAARLRPIAGFRNVLVQGYLQVDLVVVERVLREELDNLAAFGEYAQRYIDRAEQA